MQPQVLGIRASSLPPTWAAMPPPQKKMLLEPARRLCKLLRPKRSHSAAGFYILGPDNFSTLTPRHLFHSRYASFKCRLFPEACGLSQKASVVLSQ